MSSLLVVALYTLDMSHIPDVDVDGDVSPVGPESPIALSGIDHITIEGGNREDTIEFYRDLLGMRLVIDQPNRDRTHLDHLFFDTGDGRLLTFFVTDDHDTDSDELEPSPGQVHHIAYRVDADELVELRHRLQEHGYPCSEVYDRGFRDSVYTQDHNGLIIELTTDTLDLPDEHRNTVLALGHHYRITEGADFIAERHVRRALDEMGLSET